MTGYLLLLDGDCMWSIVDVFWVVVQGSAFVVQVQGSVLVTQVLFQLGFGVPQEPGSENDILDHWATDEVTHKN